MLALLALGVGLILFDRARIVDTLAKADWRILPAALLVIVCSNGVVSGSYVILARLVGIEMSRPRLGVIYFTTTVMNRLVRSGGAAGFSIRYLMMKPYGISLSDVLNSSFIHFLLGSLIMLGMLPLSILYLAVHTAIPPGMTTLFIVLAALSILMWLGAYLVVFSDRLRCRLRNIVVWVVKKISRRDITHVVEDYIQQAATSAALLLKDRIRLVAVMLLLLAEWMANVLLLGLCLRAFGANLDLAGVAAVFVIGTLTGVMTALPGGIGIQEGMMTSLAVLQGISFEQSVLAAMLYRVLQTVLPYLASLVFYPRLMLANDIKIETNDARI